MTVTITLTSNVPTIGADADTWGAENNANWAAAKADLDAIAAQYNITQPLAVAALPKSGGTMTGDQVLANVGPGSIYSAGFRGAPVVNITTDRTLALTDAGKTIRATSASSPTVTIPPNSSVALPIGTVIILRSFTTGTITVARGSGVALRITGSETSANASISAYGRAVLVKEEADVWFIEGLGVS